MNRYAQIFLPRFLGIGKLQMTNVEKAELLISLPADCLPYQIRLEVKEETSEVPYFEHRFCSTENCIHVHLKVDQKCLESFEMWCCRKMEKIIWTDSVVERNILLTIK